MKKLALLSAALVTAFLCRHASAASFHIAGDGAPGSFAPAGRRSRRGGLKAALLSLAFGALALARLQAGALDPNAFASLGANPFTQSGAYSIDTAATPPVLMLPDASTVNGVVSGGIAVFTFNDIAIAAGMTVNGLQNSNSRPFALLSHDFFNMTGGTINTGGATGANIVPVNGANGGNAGPGGGGGAGGGGSLGLPSGAGGTGGGGTVGGGNGGDGSGTAGGAGGDGGSVVAGGGGTHGVRGGGGAFGGNGGNGVSSPGSGGTAYGDLALTLQGGSGGAGGVGGGSPGAAGGGGGGGAGGAVELGAIGNLTLSGMVLANGGASSGDPAGLPVTGGGGGGAAGGIVVHAPTVSLSGNLNAIGGTGAAGGSGGGGGRVLILTGGGTLASGSLAESVSVSGGSTQGGNPGQPGVKQIFQSTVTVTTTADEDNGTTDPSQGTGTSLREAINFANSAAYGVTITFDPTVFAAATAPHVIDLLTVLPDLTSNVILDGPGANVLTVERSHTGGTPNFRIFTINNGTSSGPTVTISGMTIANGAENFGGGIYNHLGTLAVENCTLSQNAAAVGSIVNDAQGGSATLSVTNSTFSQNSIAYGGGGIYNNGTSNGTATLTVTNSTFSKNLAGGGGGILNDATHGTATLSVINSTFSQNSVNGFGGGIYNGGENGSATLTITNSTFSQNAANNAGGIYNDGINGSATLNVTNSTFSRNSATTGTGGGIRNDAAGGSATLKIGNTILKTGASGANIVNNSGVVTSLGYNLSDDNGGALLTGTGDQTNTDPLLDPAGLQDNGGPTQTIALQLGSPAIDKGKDIGPDGVTPTGRDQRGVARPFRLFGTTPAPGGDYSDIGAFEAVIFIVTTTADEDNGTPDPSQGTGTSLREAINAANNLSDAIIVFDPTVFATHQTITLGGTQLVITNSMIITGPAAGVTVDANNRSRVFTINLSGITVSMSGLTITGGNSVGSTFNGEGGGIYLNNGNLTLLGCTVSNNSADSGGGIAKRSSAAGVLTVTDCAITGNTSNSSGGGIFNLDGPLTITGSTIANNTSNGAFSGIGGGIENYALMTLTNCTISGNQVKGTHGGHGGGIYTPAGSDDGSPVRVTNCTITGNTAVGADSAGGVRLDYVNKGTLTVSNTIIAGNSGTGGATADVNSTDSGTTFTSGGYNLIGDASGSTGFTNGANGDQVGTTGSPIDPKLDPAGLQNNGGPIKTIALKSGSPAIDKGKDNPGGKPTGEDQRHSLRPVGKAKVAGGDGSDIGAFELAATFRGEKQDVLALVRSLIPSGNKNADKELQKAATAIAGSVDPKLWVDDFHPVKKSDTVFKQERAAMENLLKAIAITPGLAARAQEAINDLVEVDGEIAQLAIDEAVAGGADRKLTAMANNEMAQARQAVAAGHPGDAIDHYGRAWVDAVNAPKARK
jgi:fibronectin-binding autotransporter adhesin